MTCNWVQTSTGQAVDIFNPDLSTIFLVDIAHALSNQARFNGHTKEFYSVAQHSVLVAVESFSRNDSKEVQRLAFMHDAAEAYLGDLVRPIKDQMPYYWRVEENMLKTIFRRFGIPLEVYETHWDYVKQLDDLVLATEADSLFSTPSPKNWNLRERPLPYKIRPYNTKDIKQIFLSYAHGLGIEEQDV